MMEFFEAVKNRRSIRALEDEAVVPDEEVVEIVKSALNHTPTAFNGQETRVAILFGEHHKQLWDDAEKIARDKNPVDFERTQQRIQGFRNGHGTVLFFQDWEVIEGLQNKMPHLRDALEAWAHQNQGMLQYVIWTGLEEVGYAASLQHIDIDIRPEWNIPENWKIIAQMPFGKQAQPAIEKEIIPVEKKLVVLK